MNKIDWTKWSAIAEIFSSLAILITLIFLAVQTNQNTNAIDAQLTANRAQARASIWEFIYRSIDASTANPRISLSLQAEEPLTPEAEAQLGNWLLGFWGAREFVWLQYQDGVVDEATCETVMYEPIMFEYANAKQWWDRFAGSVFDPEFVQEVERRHRP